MVKTSIQFHSVVQEMLETILFIKIRVENRVFNILKPNVRIVRITATDIFIKNLRKHMNCLY